LIARRAAVEQNTPAAKLKFEAKKFLDADHYDLQVTDANLEFSSVGAPVKARYEGPILVFVRTSLVGKTLAREVDSARSAGNSSESRLAERTTSRIRAIAVTVHRRLARTNHPGPPSAPNQRNPVVIHRLNRQSRAAIIRGIPHRHCLHPSIPIRTRRSATISRDLTYDLSEKSCSSPTANQLDPSA